MRDEKARNVRGTLSTKQKSLFVAGTRFSDYGGRVRSPFREMTINRKVLSGRHSIQVQEQVFKDWRRMELPSNYKGTGAKVTKSGVFTRQVWRTSRSFNGPTIALTPKQFREHLIIVAHQIPIALEHWKAVLIARAQAVFEKSFTLKRFNSYGTAPWKRLKRWTRVKRLKKGTWPGAGGILQEYGYLSKAWRVTRKPGMVALTNVAKYAGVHNCPTKGMTYGNGFGGKYPQLKPVTQRQFMGHSTHISSFIENYERRYLFDTIFRAPYIK